MIQLVIEGTALPETSRDKYRCYPSELSREIDMISGRRVRELRGKVQKIEWSYDYMTDSEYKRLLALLRGGKALQVAYLPDDGAELLSGEFWVESIGNPAFAFSKGMKAYWHNVSFTLREVRPHD